MQILLIDGFPNVFTKYFNCLYASKFSKFDYSYSRYKLSFNNGNF